MHLSRNVEELRYSTYLESCFLPAPHWIMQATESRRREVAGAKAARGQRGTWIPTLHHLLGSSAVRMGYSGLRLWGIFYAM